MTEDAADDLEVEEIVDAAKQLSDDGNAVESERMYLRAAIAGHVGSMGYLGSLHHRRGELLEAMRWYRVAAAVGDLTATINLATLLDYEGDPEEAERLFRSLLHSPLAQCHFAAFLARRERLEESVDMFQEAIPGLPSPSARAHVELAGLLACLGRPEEAIEEYRTALGLEDLGFALAAIEGLGQVLERLDRDAEADRLYRSRMGGDDEIALAAELRLAALLFNSDRFAESEAVLRHLVETNAPPFASLAFRNLGVLYVHLGRREEAIEMFHAAADRGDQDALTRLAGVFLAEGRADEAEEAIDRLTDCSSPEFGARAWLAVAAMHFGKDQWDQAEAACHEVLTSDDTELLALAHLLLGNVAVARDDPNAARAEYAKALEMDNPSVVVAVLEALSGLDEDEDGKHET